MEKEIERLYNEVVKEVHWLDCQIAELQGKRDALTNIRLDLFDILNKCGEAKVGDEDGSN